MCFADIGLGSAPTLTNTNTELAFLDESKLTKNDQLSKAVTCYKERRTTKRVEGKEGRCPLSLCYRKWGDNSNDDWKHGLRYYSCSVGRPHRFLLTRRSYLCRGQSLGRVTDKSLKSFPPFYSQSPLQLSLEIYNSSNSSNLLHISSNSCKLLCICIVQLLYRCKGESNSNRKPYPLLV
jgi:hypothetical protein